MKPSAKNPAGGKVVDATRSSTRLEPPAWKRALDGHEADLAGLACLVLGVLSALGIWLDLAGPVGRAVNDGAGVLVGVARVVVPILLGVAGFVLISEGRVVERARIAIGLGAASASVLGLLHLAHGPDAWPGGADEVRRAGGWAGAAIGQPLRALLSGWGATVALVALGLAAALVLTGTSLRAMGRRAAAGVGPTVRLARRWVDELTTLNADRRARRAAPAGPDAAGGAAGARPALFDIDAEGADGFDDLDRAGELDGDGEGGSSSRGPSLGARRRGPALYDVALEAGDDALDERSDDPAAERGTDPLAAPAAAPEAAARRSPARAGRRVPTGPDAGTDPGEQLEIALGPAARPGRWKLPSVSLLGRTAKTEIDRGLIEEAGKVLEGALAAHGVDTRLVGMTVGPTVTRYELELGPGVKVARVTSLNKDIAYAMASADVRILAPIPGRSAIGVEVPNPQRQLVSLGDILTSPEAKAAKHPLEVAIGRDIAGRAVMMNLATTPHLLIAGATGAGKSSGLNCLVTSILVRATPEEVRMILIDPKRVEMGQYNRLPHLLTPVVTSPKKAANALQWAVKEMELRYDLLHEVGTRDITGYNAAFDRGELVPEPGTDKTYVRLPYIVVIVDELNDLMMVAARDVEESITRLAQMARAVGIHLVIATQRPSVNVITGVIKANIPARMAFAVSSATDSRVILDQIGAERLVGKGDMLLLGPASSVAQRIQGAFVGEDEVRAIVGKWRQQIVAGEEEGHYVDGLGGDEGPTGFETPFSSDDDDDETLVRHAMELVVRNQLGSTSMLQRKLKVGFARAGRIMDLLEQRGVVGPSEGSKARAVLMTPEELDGLLGDARR